MLNEWLIWASRCRIPAFVELRQKIKRNMGWIEAAMLNNLLNALVEPTNTKIRVLTRVALGFRSPEALIAMAIVAVDGVCPDLPGRAAPVPFKAICT